MDVFHGGRMLPRFLAMPLLPEGACGHPDLLGSCEEAAARSRSLVPTTVLSSLDAPAESGDTNISDPPGRIETHGFDVKAP